VSLELAFEVEATGVRGRMRQPAASDIDAITAACQDPDIQRFTRVPIPYTRDDAEQFVGIVSEQWAAGTPTVFAILVDDALVGTLGLVHLDEADGWGEVGYWTAPHARRRGITTTALQRLCTWAFDDLGLHRLELQTAPGNLDSEAVARRAGYVLEGRRRSAAVLRAVNGLPEERTDMTVWGLLPSDLG
jgi:RimJ/RimL family protein N-acetyltransferase